MRSSSGAAAAAAAGKKTRYRTARAPGFFIIGVLKTRAARALALGSSRGGRSDLRGLQGYFGSLPFVLYLFFRWPFFFHRGLFALFLTMVSACTRYMYRSRIRAVKKMKAIFQKADR